MAKAKVGSWAGSANRIEKNGEHLEAMETRESPTVVQQIVLPKLDIRTIKIPVVGDSELIVHNWSEKAIKEMLDKQMGVASAGKEKKDPVRDFLESLYTVEEGEVIGKDPFKLGADGHPDIHIKAGKFGFPAIAFKNAAVEACTSLGKSITKVAARQCFHVFGELVTISGTPRMRRDMVRLQGMNHPADVRFRAGFKEWTAEITVRYNARVLSAEQVVNLFNTAGFAVGVGEWRSEKDGGFGLFHVKTD